MQGKQKQHKPAIVMIGTFLSSQGGNHSVCEDLSNNLKKSGWSVTTSSAKSGRLARVFDMLATVWRQRYQYELAVIDVYSGSAFLWAEWTSWIVRAFSKPYILVLRGGNLPNFAKENPSRIMQLFKNAARIVVLSDYLAKQIAGDFQNMVTIPNPIDISNYSFQLRSKPQARLLYLRAFHKVYNPVLGAEALSLLLEQIPDIELLMVGPDKGDGTYQEFEEYVSKNHLEAHVKLIGSVPKQEVPQWFPKADIFINTTDVDNTPISVIEAMISGLCIVSTNVGGIPYLLEDGVNALLVPPNDPQAMAKAIHRILIEEGLAERLSRNARLTAETFDWGQVLPQWEDLISAITDKDIRKTELNGKK